MLSVFARFVIGFHQFPSVYCSCHGCHGLTLISMGLVLQLSWLPLVDINLHGSSIAAVMVAMGFHQFPSVYRSCHGCHGCSVAGGFRRKAKRCESDASSGFASDISSKEGIGNCISPLKGLPR